MAFTRFNYDKSRTLKQLQQSTGPGRWMIDVPGNGNNPCFIEDPQIRPQKWGGNLMTESIQLEDELRGLNRKNNKDDVNLNNFMTHKGNSQPIYSDNCNAVFTDESRASHPAWMYRDLEHNNFDVLHYDPQLHSHMSFRNNVSSRIVEKDNYNMNKSKCKKY